MFSSPKGNGGKSVTGSQGHAPTSANSTPPPGHSSQQPAVTQQQPQPGVPYTYAAPPHTTYPIPFPFALVGAAHGHGHHNRAQGGHAHQSNPGGGGGGIGGGPGNQQGAPSALIDPMLSTLSDGEGGMSEDEGAGGVKGGPNTSVSGNNGISSVNQPHPYDQQQLGHHEHDDDDYGQDEQHHGMHSVGGADVSHSGDGGQPKKKRRRQALSCTECKRRKIKCDRSNPCGPCTRRGEADKCQWSTQEPLEKFVTRAEHDLLQQKVMQLETIVATLAPRAFLGTLDHLNLPMGPPPFPFGPPPAGGPPPQQHPYPGPPPPGGPGQDGQFAPPAGPSGAPPTAHELHQAYQQHFQGYPPPHQPQPPAQPQPQPAGESPSAGHADENQMEIDGQPTQGVNAEHIGEGHLVEGSSGTDNIDPHFKAGAAGKADHAPSPSKPKSRKRKQAETEEGGDDSGASGRGGATLRGGRGKARGAKTAAVSAAPPVASPGQWNAAAAAAAEAVAIAAVAGQNQPQEEGQTADNGEGGSPVQEGVAS